MTVIEDSPGSLRHFQICALSQGEMRAALDHAAANARSGDYRRAQFRARQSRGHAAQWRSMSAGSKRSAGCSPSARRSCRPTISRPARVRPGGRDAPLGPNGCARAGARPSSSGPTWSRSARLDAAGAPAAAQVPGRRANARVDPAQSGPRAARPRRGDRRPAAASAPARSGGGRLSHHLAARGAPRRIGRRRGRDDRVRSPALHAAAMPIFRSDSTPISADCRRTRARRSSARARRSRRRRAALDVRRFPRPRNSPSSTPSRGGSRSNLSGAADGRGAARYARFYAAMYAMAAAGKVRAWLLYVGVSRRRISIARSTATP